MEEEIIKMLRSKSIGKQTAVMEKLYGVYIWRKKLYIMIRFEDFDFSEISKKHQEEVFRLIKNNEFQFSNSYQGQP
tara:strand:+ start:3619 stop:3846 length:228 start_codon:yes stop_codon:yes gene_type:complete